MSEATQKRGWDTVRKHWREQPAHSAACDECWSGNPYHTARCSDCDWFSWVADPVSV